MSRVNYTEILDDAQAANLDREFRTTLATASNGQSPVELGLATLDWIAHLAISPGKRIQLAQSFLGKLKQLGIHAPPEPPGWAPFAADLTIYLRVKLEGLL